MFAILFFAICFVLLPFRTLRIKACNYFGKTGGRAVVWVTGAKLHFEGTEHLDASRPAIYVSNHASSLDAFMAMWLSPVGTVGIAKKEVVFYPFLGQLYLLSGHLRIDRSSPRTAVASLKSLASFVHEHGLSIFIWPEGTRSKDGRLQRPFKKGFGHLAMQTGLPIVPIVVCGAQHCWRKGRMELRPVDITIRVLPPIPTDGWARKGLVDHLATVEQAIADALPDDQKPHPVAVAG